MLCVGSLSLFAACLTYPVLVAAGSVRDTLVSSLISLLPSLLMIFIASFFGVQAVAASALVTLPFQAVVAFYFVSKRLEIKAADFIRATVKSGIVAACTIAGCLMSMVIIEILKFGPIVAVLSAGALGMAAWSLGLIMTDHPLSAQLRLVASRISFRGFVVPRIFTPRWEESARSDGKSR
jgi:O-antigen/teichoic acid export membrane protein